VAEAAAAVATAANFRYPPPVLLLAPPLPWLPPFLCPLLPPEQILVYFGIKAIQKGTILTANLNKSTHPPANFETDLSKTFLKVPYYFFCRRFLNLGIQMSK
jgi:hypothetical protein